MNDTKLYEAVCCPSALLLAVSSILIATLASARADGGEWKGGDGAWSAATSWSEDKVPGLQEAIKFTGDKPAAVTLDADVSVVSLTFATARGAAINISGAHKLTIADGGVLIKSATADPENQTILAPVELAGSATFTNDNKWVHMANQLILAGPISGSGTLTVTGSGDGGVTFTADNSASFHGPIVVSSGNLFIANSGSLGDAAQGTRLVGGEMFFLGGANTAEPITIAGKGQWESMGANDQAGTIALESGAVWTIGNGGGNALRLRGAISGPPDAQINMTCGNTTLGGTDPNTFAGPITFHSDSGTEAYNQLRLAKPTGVAAIAGPLKLYGRATLLWQADDQVADDAPILLAGGVLQPAGHRDHLGVLTLTGRAQIDLKASGELTFRDSSNSAWKDKSQLLIEHWTGKSAGVTIGNSASALSAAQIAMIGFTDPAGKPKGLYHATIQSDGSLHPSNSAVATVGVAYDISDAAKAARTKLFEIDGLHLLTEPGSPLKKGDSISFFGDSITWLNGWPLLIQQAINESATTKDLGVTFHNRGINGGGAAQIRDGSADHARDDQGDNVAQAKFADVLIADHTTIAVLFIGINDVWWRNTSPDDFRQQLTDIVTTAKKQGVKLVVATMATHRELPDGKNPDDVKIEKYAHITRDVAVRNNATLVDLRKAFIAYNQNFNGTLQLDGSLVSRTAGLLTMMVSIPPKREINYWPT